MDGQIPLSALDPRRLFLLVELSRLGSMAEVAAEHALTTSTVSQQLAHLARDLRTPLLEPQGRRVRLTPAGTRLVGRAIELLAVAEAARSDLDPHAEPTGTVRAGGFASGVRRALVPAAAVLADRFSDLRVALSEHEPAEALAWLQDDDLDLALVYDYDLAPLALPPAIRATRLWTNAWGLAVPLDDDINRSEASPEEVLRSWSRRPWIVNSRNTADEEAMRTLARLYDVSPTVRHRIDSLELLEDLVLAGLGVGLLPLEAPHDPAIRVLPLPAPGVAQTAYVATRRGRESWAPVAALLEVLTAPASPASHSAAQTSESER